MQYIVWKGVSVTLLGGLLLLAVVLRGLSMIVTRLYRNMALRQSLRQSLRQPVRQPQAANVQPRLMLSGLLTAMVSSWLAPVCVIVLFFVLSGNAGPAGNSFLATGALDNPIKPVESAGSSESTDGARISTSGFPTNRGEESVATSKPTWVETGDQTISADEQLVVLSSTLWSTAEEAAAELRPRAATLVRRDFEQRHPLLIERASPRLLTDDRLIEAALKRRFLEPVEQDFGTFSSPMYRLWWQIEISPLVRTELYPDWKRGVVGNRVLAIGVALALLTLIASGVTLSGQLHRVFRHRSRVDD